MWADVADELPWKFRLVSIFASQFEGSRINPKVAACGQTSGAEAGVACAESWYRVPTASDAAAAGGGSLLRRARHRGDPSTTQRLVPSCAPGAASARALPDRRRLLARGHVQSFFDAFPEATIEMHMAPAALGEAVVYCPRGSS